MYHNGSFADLNDINRYFAKYIIFSLDFGLKCDPDIFFMCAIHQQVFIVGGGLIYESASNSESTGGAERLASN